VSGRAGGPEALSVSRWACATLLCGGKAVVSPRAPAAISLLLGGRLAGSAQQGLAPAQRLRRRNSRAILQPFAG